MFSVINKLLKILWPWQISFRALKGKLTVSSGSGRWEKEKSNFWWSHCTGNISFGYQATSSEHALGSIVGRTAPAQHQSKTISLVFAPRLLRSSALRAAASASAADEPTPRNQCANRNAYAGWESAWIPDAVRDYGEQCSSIRRSTAGQRFAGSVWRFRSSICKSPIKSVFLSDSAQWRRKLSRCTFSHVMWEYENFDQSLDDG